MGKGRSKDPEKIKQMRQRDLDKKRKKRGGTEYCPICCRWFNDLIIHEMRYHSGKGSTSTL